MSENKNVDYNVCLGYRGDQELAISYASHFAKKSDALLPSTYDLRKVGNGCVTPVKTQFTSNCWIYAGIACLESHLLLKGLVADSSDEYYDCSETHVTYSMFTEGATYGRVPLSDPDMTYAGTKETFLAYLARGLGLVAECIDPEVTVSRGSYLINRDVAVSINKARKYMVSGIKYISNPQGMLPYTQFLDEVKESLVNNGEVGIVMKWEDAYYDSSTHAFYCPQNAPGNHMVTIVGWDDSYSQTNFGNLSVQPSSDGAFIVKNSWGTGFGDAGYFYLSYEDLSLSGANCITEVTEVFDEAPYKWYIQAPFGMMSYFTDSTQGDKSVTFDVKYTTEKNNERLKGAVLFNYTPCLATVTLLDANKSLIAILVDDYYLSDVGSRTIVLSSAQEQDLGVKGTSFYIQVEYNSVNFTDVFAPVELADSDYVSMPVVAGNCSINGEDMEAINVRVSSYKEYGNIALYAITTCEAKKSQLIQEAYKDAVLPTATENAVFNLPTSHANGTDYKWNLEPVDATQYFPSSDPYIANVKTFILGGKTGYINESNAVKTIYTSCLVGGTDSFVMRKLLSTVLASKSAYTFQVESKKDINNQVVVKGNVPFSGAKMTITCNDVTIKEVVSGTTFEKDLYLYKAFDEQYVGQAVIKVSFSDDNSLVLAEATDSSMTVENPLEKGSESNTFAIVAGTVGGLAILGGLITYAASLCGGETGSLCAGEYALLTGEGFFGGSIYGDSSMGLSDLEYDSSEIFESESDCIFENLRELTDSSFSFGSNSTAPNIDASTQRCIVGEITKGGVVENVTVRGSYGDSNTCDIAGIFYKGEDVTVSNCRVNLDVKNANSFAGIAQTLTGNSTITNCTVTGSVNTNNDVAGLVLDASEGMVIDKCLVSGSLQSSSGSAYGMAKGISAKASLIQNSVCVCSDISGAILVARISDQEVTNCRAYDGIASLTGKGFVTTKGETLVTPYELLHTDIFKDLGWDFDKVWTKDAKKLYPYLINDSQATYIYPFVNPYPTSDDKYTFKVNAEIAFYGATNTKMDKLTWSLSPTDGMQENGGTTYMIEQDEFYLETKLAGMEKANYNFNLISVINEKQHGYGVVIEVEE